MKSADRIHHCDTDQGKQISHILDGYSHRTVAHDRKQSKQTETKTYSEFDGCHQVTNEENQDVKYQIGKCVFRLVVGWSIDEQHND